MQTNYMYFFIVILFFITFLNLINARTENMLYQLLYTLTVSIFYVIYFMWHESMHTVVTNTINTGN